MKIALTNLCKTTDFSKDKNYHDSISFLNEESIEFIDYASGVDTVETMVEKFNKALDSDAEIIWVIRGGVTCIRTTPYLDWDKIVNSGKRFYGLSDFTHFTTIAISKGVTCYYGQGLTHIKEYYPTAADQKFIVQLLTTGKPSADKASVLGNADMDLELNSVKVIGGHLVIFTLMQSQLKINLKDRFVFFEYHSGGVGEDLDELGYYIDQMLYVIRDNMPKGFILGRTIMHNTDGSEIPLEEINRYCVEKLLKYNLPIYYIDHFRNTITFS
jgi:muramoyltetrapeptide carboxypeptidase LdcA involved in peptidoglycan recycling